MKGQSKERDLVTKDEVPLFEQAQMGCLVSLNELMRRHDGLVQAVTRQQVLGDLSFAEALQAGRVGLWHAILGFDPHRGLAFSTYAWPAIMRQIWRAVKCHHRQHEIKGEQGGAPHSRVSPDPASLSEARCLRETLRRMVDALPPRLRGIINAYYGFGDQDSASYRQLGLRLSLSHERVRQLHQEALVILRHPAYSQTLRHLLGRHTVADYQRTHDLAQAWLKRRGGRHGR